MRGRTSTKVLSATTIALLLAEVFVLTFPTVSSASAAVYVDPVNNVFYFDGVSISFRFNVTVWVSGVSNLAGWQVRVGYDSSMLNCTRTWQPTWDSQYVFYGRNTFPMMALDSGYVLLGDVLIPLRQSAFAGTGKLCILEFAMTAEPSGGQRLSSALDITNLTSLWDPLTNEIPAARKNGSYFCYPGRGAPISSFQQFLESNPNVKMILPSDFINKPLGCGPAMASDLIASEFIYERLQSAIQGLDTDPSFVNQTQGKVIGSEGTGIVSFGGPFVNLVVSYAESGSTAQQDRAPIEFFLGGDLFGFRFSNGTDIPGAQLNVSSINHDKDMFVIEFYRDGDGRYIMLCYGLGWKGTYAAGEYFNDVIYANLQSHKESWTVVRWEDTNGDGLVSAPNAWDSYSVVAEGN